MNIFYWFLLICILCQNNIVLSNDDLQPTDVAVQTGKIVRTTLKRYVMGYGMIEPQLATSDDIVANAKVASASAGIVQQSHCVEGQPIKKGQHLYTLDSRNMDEIMKKTQIAFEFAKKNKIRKEALNATDDISHKLYEEAEQLFQSAQQDVNIAKTQRELLNILAPLNGTIMSCLVKIGESVSPNTPVAEISDLNRLDFVIPIPIDEAKLVHVKQTVLLHDNIDNSKVVGQISFVNSHIDPLTNTLTARATLSSSTNLQIGQLIPISIIVEEHTNRLAVPIESVVMKENGAIIYVIEKNIATQQNITLGLRDGKLIEIEGTEVHEDMNIVTQGSYGLPVQTLVHTVTGK
jgi:membrane fusion protein, multidrug efflux system